MPPLLAPLRTLHAYTRSHPISPSTPGGANTSKLALRLADVVSRTWDLGFTAFGGPPVHFQILHRRFVEGKDGGPAWVDETTVSLSSLVLQQPHGL